MTVDIQAVSTMSGKTKTVKSVQLREDLINQIEGMKKHGWVSNNAYFNDGSIKINMSGKSYGVKKTWLGTAKPI